MNVLQRALWHGEPKQLGELFVLKKGTRTATCELWSHAFGWELRLFVGKQTEIVQTQVCRSEDEVFATGDAWKVKMQEKGWA